jgi:hypothetical protein
MSLIAQYLSGRKTRVDFEAVNKVALPLLESLCRQWLPQGRRVGREWISINPTRSDLHPGSFSVNIRTGRWADFAVGDKGGDVVSLAAYLFGTSQIEAARTLALTLGVRP